MTIKLNGSTAGSVALDAPASTTGSNDITFKLPVADGSDGQFLSTNGNGQLAFSSVATPSAFVTGMIIMWSGAANAVPTGWVLCDGNNSTPNLAGKFVVGYHASNGDYDVGDTGGAETVTLTEAQMPAHAHHFLIQNGSTAPMGYAQSANGTNIGWAGTNTKGSSQAHENRPPFYALCYIMKT